MNLKHANTLHYFIIVVSFSVLLIKSASLINNDPHQQPKNITITSTKTFQNSSSSTIITKSNLREIFDFSGAGKGEGKLLITKKEFIDTSTPSSSFTHRMTSSTFRPTSSILFLTPPKPKHIASIVSELNSIELDPSGGYLTLRWSVIVVLKANSTTNSTTLKFKRSTETTKEKKEENEVENDKKEEENEEEEEEEVVVNFPPEKGTETPLTNFSTISTTPQTPTNSSSFSSSTTTPENITISTSISPAKVEQARTPLKWVITLRRYGHAHRERVPIEDRENNLDPPFTGNKSYHYRLEHLSPESSYELCIQSVNGGRLKESAEVRRLFPLNAHASGVGGAGNPLFICKEVYVSPPELTTENKNTTETDLFEVEILGSQKKTHNKNRDQIRGRLAEGEKSSEGSETPAIEVSEEAADAFVVYTAITSGSTTVLLLIVVVTFCCCRCNKRKTEHREYRQNILYSRAPAAEGGGGSHGEGSGSAPKYF